MKLAATNGVIDWIEWIAGADGLDDRGWSIVVGPDGHPVMTGILSTTTDPASYVTSKRSGLNGNEIWRRTISGAINHPDRDAGWLAVCDGGDIVMANRTWAGTASYDAVLHRYASADGATVWAVQYDSPTSGPDDPLYMIRDAAGDLLVSGITGGDFMALKFDQTDGDLLWSASYDGPPGYYDAAACIIEGPAGEVILSGYSDGTGTSWDIATVGLDPTTGDQLWVERYDAGDGLSDEPRCLALSPQGDLYVVGYGYMEASASDMLALRYLFEGQTGIELAGEVAGSAPRLLSAYPNPFLADVALSFALPRGGETRVAIYDTGGRLLTILHDGALGAGAHRLTWDGRDARGVAVSAGLYLARIEAAGFVSSRKIVSMR